MSDPVSSRYASEVLVDTEMRKEEEGAYAWVTSGSHWAVSEGHSSACVMTRSYLGFGVGAGQPGTR